MDAYAWLSGVYLDISHNAGRIVINIHPRESAWQQPPLAQVSIALGEQIQKAEGDNSPATYFPTLAELMADPEFASAYNVVGAKLYAVAMQSPVFSGASQI